MSASDYLSTRAELQKEDEEFLELMDSEDDALRTRLSSCLTSCGMNENDVRQVGTVFIKNKEACAKLLQALDAKEEEEAINPRLSAMYTFIAFMVFGSVPLFANVIVSLLGNGKYVSFCNF